MKTAHTPESLPPAVAELFRLNNFEVKGPLKIHGAEIDLMATSRTDPFASPIYLEVTTEYVENIKYGKDATKALLIREKDPSSRFVIVSSEGFSLPVAERAKESRIETVTYDALFSRFEKFGQYSKQILDEGKLAEDLEKLEARYEEPNFHDALGVQRATEFLTQWKNDPAEKRLWLVIVGEYGTGKTALTHMLTRRWLREYRENPSRPIPLRLELRDFTRQFDARGLLHHFLDKHDLAHISVDFLLSLIRTGRVVLLLDGYDEMAQYLHARERRVCLEALASFAAEGAKGIITSRPNYFSEAEELQVMESLYRSIENFRFAAKDFEKTIKAEQAVDTLLGAQFIDRFERSLQDLSPEQTRALIERVLANNPEARAVVLDILGQVFRALEAGDRKSLSGKPVIITYLLEIADDLKAHSTPPIDAYISEWQVYTLIVEKLMARDFARAPFIVPKQRLMFLQALAVLASKKEYKVLDEDAFVQVIKRIFATELRRREEHRDDEIRRLFDDLRASATLTRGVDGKRDGWMFSHNSLREFLCAQHLLEQLNRDSASFDPIPVTDAMRTFVASRRGEETELSLTRLGSLQRAGQREVIGPFLCLLWDAILKLSPSRGLHHLLRTVSDGLNFPETAFDRISVSTLKHPVSIAGISFRNSTISDCKFEAADLKGSDFSYATLQGVSFASANLREAKFTGATIHEVDVTDADFHDADINDLDPNSSVLRGGELLTGKAALGFLAYSGAEIQGLDPIHILQHSVHFDIADKIARKLVEGGLRQERGLTQRGAAHQAPDFARRFLGVLERQNLVASSAGRSDLVEITESGRHVLGDLIERRRLDPRLAELFE